MRLPAYYIADLPSEADLSPLLLREACQSLRRNRRSYLIGRSTDELIGVLSAVSDNWLEANDPYRALALERGPKSTGFSRSTIERGLDELFSGIDRCRLEQVIVQDLGHERRLDEMTAMRVEEESGRRGLARGPELITHIAGGVLPNPVIISLMMGLLIRSAQIVKCPAGGSFLPRLFAHSVYAVAPKLGACMEIIEWPGGEVSLEEIVFEESDLVTATGTDETLVSVQSRIPSGTRMVGYGHKVSLAYISGRGLADKEMVEVASKCARDVTAWDQQGCLSPHVIYVENGGAFPAERFAEAVASALCQIEEVQPRGALGVEQAADLAMRRSVYEIRAANSPDTRLWSSDRSTAWTVVYESDPRFHYTCLNRFIYVKPSRDADETLHQLEPLRGKVSTVGLAAAGREAERLATTFARWGVSRVCPVGKMQSPPLLWRHDGRPRLGELVDWTDWERE